MFHAESSFTTVLEGRRKGGNNNLALLRASHLHANEQICYRTLRLVLFEKAELSVHSFVSYV